MQPPTRPANSICNQGGKQPRSKAIISPNCERRLKPSCNERIGTTHSARRKHYASFSERAPDSTFENLLMFTDHPTHADLKRSGSLRA
jgi:hypothetical protein